MPTSEPLLFSGALLLASLLTQLDPHRSASAIAAGAEQEIIEFNARSEEAEPNRLNDSHEVLNFESAAKLNRLADLYRRRGLYSYAEAILTDLLEMRQRTLEPNDAEIATYLNNLAFLYGEQGKYGEAESVYLRALVIMEKTRGTEHPDFATELIIWRRSTAIKRNTPRPKNFTNGPLRSGKNGWAQTTPTWR